MGKLRMIAEHPHLLRCPHCNTERPLVAIEQDALNIITLHVDGSGVLVRESAGVSLLDNIEVHFSCCSERVHDRELANELIDMTFRVTGGESSVAYGNYDFNRFAKDMREISRSKGFENPQSLDEIERTMTKLMLVVTEVAEAAEEVRKTQDKDAFAEELADIIIRVADLSHDLEIDLDAVVNAKIEKNVGRPKLHGKRV